MTDKTVSFDTATGLAPAIVQDSTTGQVLMLGYVNEESIRLTQKTGYVHFWSRSRQEIWKKGETSGNTLQVVSISLDCDNDTLLFQVRPDGPICHLDTTTCFDLGKDLDVVNREPISFEQLAALWKIISARAVELPKGSYTVRLLSEGVDATGRKLVEEATEVLLAARDHRDGGNPDRVHEEVADLLYHLLVVLAERGLNPAGSMSILRKRSS